MFNVIFDSGNFPSIWTEGIIIPLFKKGHANDANNYRGITLISCLEKIFTSVINNRLLKWSNENNIVTDAQFGFKPGYGTSDAIFSLHTVISKVLSSKKKLYCCFVDYRKAFDSVNRYKLLFKLARSGITGKLYGIIKSMYESLKSSVKFQCQFSQFFDCNVGLMQGEAMSPFLFSMYINDFENELIKDVCEPIYLHDISVFLLMYADDTVLLSETAGGLQKMIDTLHTYSTKWNLCVNTEKTKIVVFRNSAKLSTKEKWVYNNESIEVVDCFNYLGLTLNFNGKFTKTLKIIASQGEKCMWHILSICNRLSLNMETKLHVFDTYVSSVLNYGCEVWGFHPAHDIEKVHMNFCKRILNVKRSATNVVILSELGRTPLCIDRKIRILKYWLKLLKTKNCILKSLYEDMLQCQNCCNWLCQVKSILLSLGFGDVWYSQHVNHIEWFLKCVKMRLTDNFIQERDTILDNSSKCNIYKHLIDRFCLQYYLKISMPDCYTILITRFRVSAHTLLIEKGRYHNIERDKRLCQMCDMNDVEDEYHFILKCPFYTHLRHLYIKKYYWSKPSVFKLVQLLSVQNRKELCNIGKYLKNALYIRPQYM